MHSAHQLPDKQKPAAKLNLNKIDSIYSYLFGSARIDKSYSSYSTIISYYGMKELSTDFQTFVDDRCKSAEVLKQINLTLYHMTRGFAYEYFSSTIDQTLPEAAVWMEKAFEEYSLALTAYFDDIQQFHSLKRSYQKLVKEANGTYQKELYDFVFRLNRPDNTNFPSFNEIVNAIKKLQENVAYLDKPYQETGYALLAILNNISPDKLKDIDFLASLRPLVSKLYDDFNNEGYGEDLWLIQRFSKIGLNESQVPSERHWLLHLLFTADNTPAFIKELSKTTQSDSKHGLESKQEQQEAGDTLMETTSAGPKQFERKILRAKKSADGQGKTKITRHSTSQNLQALDSDSDDEIKKIMRLR